MKITVETDDLVTLAMIAERTKQNKSTVTMWAARRATNGFPKPVIEVAAGARPVRLYSWNEVLAWLTTE